VDLVSFTTGLLSAVFAYAVFSQKEEIIEDLEEEHEQDDLVINDETTGRHVTMSCQTCRKLKKHKEVKPNLYQCCKCKRHVDLRAS
jgi:acetyl-CoA carboxylase beta subunit